MEIKKEKIIPVAVSADTAWRFMENLDAVAACFPGAAITQKIDDNKFNGTVTVKIGPVTSTFNGILEIRERNAATRTLIAVGSGGDRASRATVELHAAVAETGPGTAAVAGKTTVNVTGKLVSVAGRMIGTVADKLIEEFAKNFADRVKTFDNAQTQAQPHGPERPQNLNLLSTLFGAFWARLKALMRLHAEK
ncbi:MAG: CoxG family protein [Alphaproteobacteria bacterium]